jgi:hypothetical protein
MELLWDRIKTEIARQIAVRIADPRMVIVTGYDPATHTSKGLVMPEAAYPDQAGDVVETNFGAIATLSSGGAGVYVGRSPNDQVLVVHQEHHGGSPVAVGRVHTTSDPPPAVPAGEVWMIHASGSYLKATADGKVSINGQVEIDLTGPRIRLTAANEIDLIAPAVRIGASLSDTLRGFCTSLFKAWADTHVHSNGNGGANTGTPTTTAGAGALTTVVQGE